MKKQIVLDREEPIKITVNEWKKSGFGKYAFVGALDDCGGVYQKVGISFVMIGAIWNSYPMDHPIQVTAEEMVQKGYEVYCFDTSDEFKAWIRENL